MAEAVVATIIRHDLTDSCLISSFNPRTLIAVSRSCSQEIPVAFTRSMGLMKFTLSIPQTSRDHPEYPLVTKSYMAWVGRQSSRVHTWTLEYCQDSARLTGLEVDAIITNRPAEIVEALSKSPGSWLNKRCWLNKLSWLNYLCGRIIAGSPDTFRHPRINV